MLSLTEIPSCHTHHHPGGTCNHFANQVPAAEKEKAEAEAVFQKKGSGTDSEEQQVQVTHDSSLSSCNAILTFASSLPGPLLHCRAQASPSPAAAAAATSIQPRPPQPQPQAFIEHSVATRSPKEGLPLPPPPPPPPALQKFSPTPNPWQAAGAQCAVQGCRARSSALE